MRLDIADYKRRSDRLRWDDLDFGTFRERPLDGDTLRTIEYMHDVELPGQARLGLIARAVATHSVAP